MAQNLVSASLAEEKAAGILKKIKEVRNDLDFLVSLSPEEMQGLVKTGNNFMPFVEKAYNVICSHPEIMPGTFDIEEFKRDYHLSKDLIPIVNESAALTEGLQNTHTAVKSDSMTGSLEIYSAVKASKDKIPGLNVVADEMSEFFKKNKK
jgi:hypothetical protein